MNEFPGSAVEEGEVTIPLVREVNGKTVLTETGYRAIRTRPASADEVAAWRAQ